MNLLNGFAAPIVTDEALPAQTSLRKQYSRMYWAFQIKSNNISKPSYNIKDMEVFVLKKLRIIYLFYLIVITLAGCVKEFNTVTEPANITVYYADRQMLKLVPVSYNIEPCKTENQCRRIIEELTYDRGYNSNIRQMIPEDSVNVRIKDGIVTVNLRSEYFDKTDKNRRFEELIVYQLVNSLSSVEGVSRVEFLIDGKKEKDFFGFIDMREAFIPDYYV